METEDEINFLYRIDCNFPYSDRNEAIKLIDQAVAFSSNALFTVIEEICRISPSKKTTVSTSTLLDLLNLAANKLNHPIKELIVDVAIKMIWEQDLPVDDVILKMETVKKYPGQYAALSILYFSCDDTEEKLEPIWNSIINEWKK